MKDLTHVLLGVPTVFGDSDVAQTHIMVMSIFLGFLSVAGVMVTLWLQQATLKSQIEISALQAKVHEKTLLPLISLKNKPLNKNKTVWAEQISLKIQNNNAIIYSYGIKTSSELTKHHTNHFVSLNLPLIPDEYLFMDISILNPILFKYKNEFWKDVPENERDEAIIEIIFGDLFSVTKYRCEYYLDMNSNGINIKLIYYGEN